LLLVTYDFFKDLLTQKLDKRRGHFVDNQRDMAIREVIRIAIYGIPTYCWGPIRRIGDPIISRIAPSRGEHGPDRDGQA